MESETAGAIVFLGVFGGGLAGVLFGGLLPEHAVGEDTRDVVKLGMGVIGTMTALVLGLLVASSKQSYETQKDEITRLSVTIIELDSLLTRYGPATAPIRGLLRDNVELAINRLWPKPGVVGRIEPSGGWEAIFRRITELEPPDEDHRWLRSQALELSMDARRIRWMLYEHGDASIPTPLLAVVIVWLAVLFASFGLFAPRNGIVVATHFVCAVSIALAMYMILDLGRPFRGLIQISNEPLQAVLEHLGK
jgi:hypothetical protein